MKSIMITGASAGIGRAVAERFLAEGWRVGLIARRAEALEDIASVHEGAMALPCDVTDAGAVEAAFERFCTKAGRLDVLFNNAGMFGTAAPIDELSLEDWRELAEDDELRAVSIPVFGPRVQREFRNLARRLRRDVRRRVERGVVEEWIGIEALMESLEVLSLAAETARETAGDHLRAALDDSRQMFREQPLSAPLRCSINNMKLGYRLVGDMIDISREVFDDLERVNRERRERSELLDG